MCKLFLLFAAFAALQGCADFLPDNSRPAGKLGLSFVEDGSYTKGGTSIPEGVVEDVNVYVFGEGGELVCSRFFRGEDVFIGDLQVSPGKEYSVYAVANWGSECIVEDKAAIEALTYSADNPADLYSDRGSAILCGKVDKVLFPLEGDMLEIGLRRLYCNVRLKFHFAYINTGIELSVNRISVKNVPRSVALFSDNVAEDVADGLVFEGDALSMLDSEGVSFPIFENMQGEIAGSSSNKRKASLLSQEQQQVCSFVEMECSYHSAERTGTITYRFFLGTSHADCNVPRNTTQTVTVRFMGSVSPNENSVSVDNSALLYRPSIIVVSPSYIQFNSANRSSMQCNVTIYPTVAYDKRVVWKTSNARVASVDQNGLITTEGKGNCVVTVSSVDRPDVYAEVKVKVAKYTGGS